MTDSLLGANAIDPSLAAFAVPIDSVLPHPDNMRYGNIEAIATSLARYGQVRPIVVQKSTNYIVAGNHTHASAQTLGWDQIAAAFVDMDDKTALAYLIADNKTSDLGAYHRERLVGALQRMADVGWLSQTLWSADELDSLFAMTEAAIVTPEQFSGTFALSEAQIKAFQERAQKSGAEVGHKRFREVPLLLREDDHRLFIENVSKLEVFYGTAGKVATIIEAVTREAALIPPPEVSPKRADA